MKESQGQKGLYRRREAKPSRRENPEDKSWSSMVGFEHRAINPIPEKIYSAMKSQSSIAGWIFGKRNRQRKGMKTAEFNIATWNVIYAPSWEN